MSRYAEVVAGVVVNVAVCDDPAFAAARGWVGPVDTLHPEPGVGWGFDGTTWTPPAPRVAPGAAEQATLLTDISTVNAGWSTLTGAEQQATVVRLLQAVARLVGAY